MWLVIVCVCVCVLFRFPVSSFLFAWICFVCVWIQALTFHWLVLLEVLNLPFLEIDFRASGPWCQRSVGKVKKDSSNIWSPSGPEVLALILSRLIMRRAILNWCSRDEHGPFSNVGIKFKIFICFLVLNLFFFNCVIITFFSTFKLHKLYF